MNIKQMMNTVNKWRTNNIERVAGGVIVVCDDEIQGWVNELRDPEHWRPGCIAINENGELYLATGGDDQNGAKSWQPMTDKEILTAFPM
jgi:hypothetical protein